MPKPARFQLSRPRALSLIREFAADSGSVVFSNHALKRMKQRKVTPQEVLACLLKGVIVEGPALGVKGDWELAVERFGAGRKLRVAVAIDIPQRLVVITVYSSEE